MFISNYYNLCCFGLISPWEILISPWLIFPGKLTLICVLHLLNLLIWVRPAPKKMSADPVLEALLDGDWKVLHTRYPTQTGQDLLFSKDSKNKLRFLFLLVFDGGSSSVIISSIDSSSEDLSLLILFWSDVSRILSSSISSHDEHLDLGPEQLGAHFCCRLKGIES